MTLTNLATLLAETAQTEPILEVIGFVLVFGSFFLAIFFIYQVIYYAVILFKMIFGATQKSKATKIFSGPYVSIPVALIVGGIVFYLLSAYGVIDVAGTVSGIAKWFEYVFTKH